MFFQPNIGLTLAELAKKRRFGDLTQNLPPMDLSVPSSLPQPDQPVIPQAGVGRSKLDILGNILNAAAQGFAVATSDNPSQTLMQQIEQRRREAMQKQSQEFQAKQQERQYQFEAQKQQAGFGQEQKLQESGQTHQEKMQENKFKNDVFLNSIEFGQRKDLQKQDLEGRKALAEMNNTFDLTRDASQFNYKMAEYEARDEASLKKMEIDRAWTAMLAANKYHSSVPIDKAYNIIQKLEKGIALTPEDTATIKQSQRVLDSVIKGGQGIGGAKFQAKSALQQQKDEADIVQQILKNDRVVEKNPYTGAVTVTETPADLLEQKVGNYLNIYRKVKANQPLGNTPSNQGTKEVLPDGRVQTTYSQTDQTQSGNIPASEVQTMNNINNFLDSGGDPNSIDLNKLSPSLRQQLQNRINAKKKKFGSTFGK